MSSSRIINKRDVIKVNKNLWDLMYLKTKLKFPDENLVRLFSRNEPKIPLPPAKLLDHGFGTGNNAFFFAQRGYEVYGAEVSEVSLKTAQELFKANGLTGDFRPIRGLELPYEDELFDIIVSWNCIHYNATRSNIDIVVNELYRILKPGGTLLLSTISREHSLCNGAEDLGSGKIRVRDDYRFDKRGGLTLFAPESKEHFIEVYARRYKDVKYGWINDNLFIPDKTLGCHLLYGRK